MLIEWLATCAALQRESHPAAPESVYCLCQPLDPEFPGLQIVLVFARKDDNNDERRIVMFYESWYTYP